jgi:LPXTG-motif cell wall-anchored protein
MSAPTPNQPNDNKGLDWAITIVGFLAIALLAGALVSSYFPKMPPTAILAMRYAGFVCIGLFALGSIVQNWQFLTDMSRSRTTQNGANSLVLTVAVIAIVVVLNWLGTRYHTRLDMTSNAQFTLSPQSKKIASGLKNDLKLTAFIGGNDQQGRQLKDLMAEYGYVTQHLKLETIDPEREPGKVRMFFQAHPNASQRRNVLMIEDPKGHLTEAQGVSEQDVTAALLKATQDKQKTVYFLQGHGESDPEGFQQDGYSQIKQSLEKQNYVVKKLSLFTSKNVIPTDCDVLIEAGARKTLPPDEVKAVTAYVHNGGKLGVFLNPDVTVGLEDLLAEEGIQVQNDLAVDPGFHLGNDAAVVVVQSYPSNAVTDGLQPTIFPAARSLVVADKTPANVALTSLIETSNQSFSKRNLRDNRPEFNPSVDKKGPLKLALMANVSASGSVKADRILAVGNANFVANAFSQAYGNPDFFLNGVNWLAEQDNLVSIAPKNAEQRTVFLTGQQQGTIFWGTVGGAPAAMLLAGGFVWWRRRRS